MNMLHISSNYKPTTIFYRTTDVTRLNKIRLMQYTLWISNNNHKRY